jgi:hypothetical protein
MTDGDNWLPDLVRLNDHGGNWPAYIEAVYAFFKQAFVYTSPRWPGRRWSLKRMPMHQGKEATFWHIVQEGPIEDSRTPDLRRCERIRWPRPIIDAAHSGRLRMWKNKRQNETRILLAVDDFSYLVVLADRRTHVMLWTAYPVEREHQRRKLTKECEEYENRANG